MAKNEIPRLIEKINLVAEAVSYTAPARATEKVVKALQAKRRAIWSVS